MPRINSVHVRFKCNFTIINLEPPTVNGFVELTNPRVWVTDVHECVYFNEYAKSAISKDIRKIIIVNGMTGSSSMFKRFDHL